MTIRQTLSNWFRWVKRDPVPFHIAPPDTVYQKQSSLLDLLCDLTIVGNNDGLYWGAGTNNGLDCIRIQINSRIATNCNAYGVYLGGALDVRFTGCVFELAQDATEHLLRFAGNIRHVAFVDCVFIGGSKSAAWVIDCEKMAFCRCRWTDCGSIRIGAREDKDLPGGRAGRVHELYFLDCTITTNGAAADGWPVVLWHGVDGVVIDGLAVTDPHGAWLNIDTDGVEKPRNVTWANVTLNGVEQTGYDGVRHNDCTESDLAGLGIGPKE